MDLRENTVGDPRLDCSRWRTGIAWFSAGILLTILFQAFTVWTQHQNWYDLLPVGRWLHPVVERELGPITLREDKGHDGQTYYLIARDPFGVRGSPDLILGYDNNPPSYRYRRILFPLVAGWAGLASPHVIFWGMIFWLALGMGTVFVGTADLGYLVGAQRWAVLLALISPGLLASVRILTADCLALGLTLVGLALWFRNKPSPALLVFALAALTKETYLLVPWSLAWCLLLQKRSRPAFALLLIPALPIGCWAGYLALQMPTGPGSGHNLSLPFVGLVRSISLWFDPRAGTDLGDRFYGFLGMGLLLLAGTLSFTTRSHPLRWGLLTWTLLAVFFSESVWGRPNNALRVLAPLWILTTLSLGGQIARRQGHNTIHPKQQSGDVPVPSQDLQPLASTRT